jgi:hypothetical protein
VQAGNACNPQDGGYPGGVLCRGGITGFAYCAIASILNVCSPYMRMCNDAV